MTATSAPPQPSGLTYPYLTWIGPPYAPRPRASVVVLLDDVWVVEYDLVVDPPGRLLLVGVRVNLPAEVSPPAGGLTAATLRRLRVGDYVRHLELLLDRFRRVPAAAKAAASLRRQGFGFLLDGAPVPGPSTTRRTVRRGRPALSDRMLARTAAAYIEALRRDSARPVLDAAARLSEKPERVRDLLHRARRRGLLEGSMSGVAGGTLTARARALLRQQPQNTRRRPRR